MVLLKRFDMVQRTDEGDWCVIDTENPDAPPQCGMSEDEAREMMGEKNQNDMMKAAVPLPFDITRIKAVMDGSEWALDVLSAPYGGPNHGKDAHGEYFSPRTNFYENEGAPLPLVAYYHGYTPDGKPQGDPEIIGRAVKTWRDAQGLWHRVILDKGKDLARRVWEAAKRGTARASTGLAGYMGRTTRDGEITHWLIGELSIWDATTDRQPANQYAVVNPAVKAAFLQAGFNLDSQDGDTGDEQEIGTSEPSVEIPIDQDNPIEREDTPMEPEVIQTTSLTPADVEQIVAQRLDAERQSVAAAAAAAQEQQARIDAAVTEARAKWEQDTAANRRLPEVNAPNIAHFGNLWQYDNLDAADLSVAAGVLGAAGKSPSENMLKALAVRVTQDENVQRLGRVRSVMQQVGMPVKANELNQSTLSSYGDQWVGVAYSTELWDKIRSLANVVANIPTVEIPPGMESVTIPIQSTSPTFYKVAQASSQATNTLGAVTNVVPTSQMGTTNGSLTVAKLGASTIWTTELDEDSLIPWANELRRDLENEAAEVLESLVIDGDTDTTTVTNINDIAGTPAGTEYYLVLNGFRKLALVTNSGNSRSASSLSVEDYLETVKLMGIAGKNAMFKDRVAFIVDPWTYWKSLELTEVKTRDSYVAPTIESGELSSLYGYRVIATHNMHRLNTDTTYGLKANSAGKIDVDTAANNLYGSILAVRWDQWRLGWKRQMKFETMRIPRADATEITVTMRVGLTYRDTEASAISYGISL